MVVDDNLHRPSRRDGHKEKMAQECGGKMATYLCSQLSSLQKWATTHTLPRRGVKQSLMIFHSVFNRFLGGNYYALHLLLNRK